MTKLHVYESSTGRQVDTVTEDGEIDYATEVGRPLFEALAEQFGNRGLSIPLDQIAERLDGWAAGDLELFAPDYLDPVVVPNVLADLREAAGKATDLKVYWTKGEGAGKIRWGTSGDFSRCVRHLGKYVADPKGLCNTYHQAAIGAPPGKGH